MSTRKLIALVVLIAIPVTLFTLSAVPPDTAWGYVFAKAGMSPGEQALWSVGMGVMCALSFTGVAGVGCIVAAAA